MAVCPVCVFQSNFIINIKLVKSKMSMTKNGLYKWTATPGFYVLSVTHDNIISFGYDYDSM